jgi:hypothetical protein
MKKLFSVFAVCFTFVATSNAQQALGLRFGGGTNFGAEVSYQKDLGTANRLEADLGLENSGFGITGIYQWVWDLNSIADGVKWYAGAGAGIHMGGNYMGAGINGQIGIEYTLQEIPLQFSLDARPGLYFGADDLFGGGAALGIRYKF